MSQSKSDKRQVKVIDHPTPDVVSMSFGHARRLVGRKLAEWTDTSRTVLRWMGMPSGSISDAVIERYTPKPVMDSGVQGFLRYPLRSQVSGESFPALARMGAGL